MHRNKGNKKNKGKNEAKQMQQAERHRQSEAESKAKREAKMMPEAARHSQSEAKVAAKREAKMMPEAARHSQSEAKVADKKGPMKEPEATSHGQSEAKAHKIHYEIYRFIYHWVFVFMWVFFMTFVAIVFSGYKLLSTNYDETLWIIVLLIGFLYLIATASALLALKELPGLLDFILKFIGIFSIFIVGITTVVILAGSNLLNINFNKTFVNTANWMCIIWWISIISLVATVIIINNATKLKKELTCFLTFITIWGFIFCTLLVMLIALGISCGHNLLGFYFDEIFFKTATSLIVMSCLASTSMTYVKYTESFRRTA